VRDMVGLGMRHLPWVSAQRVRSGFAGWFSGSLVAHILHAVVYRRESDG
jgi:hypothetical protein